MPEAFKASELHSIEEVDSCLSSPAATLRTNGQGQRVAMEVSALQPGAATLSRPRPPVQGVAVRAVAQALTLIGAWYTMSTAMNIYNKKVLGHKYGVLDGEPFPLPWFMAAIQFLMQYCFARGLHSLGVRRQIREQMDWPAWCRTVLPNGIATGLDIAFSNASYAYITLSFYTMCKSSSPLFLLGFAFIWGIEKPSWGLGLTVSIISVGLLLLVEGEAEFDIRGFLLVITAACMSGLRWTITQVLLQGGGTHSATRGTALEVMESVTPVMAATSGALSLLFEPVAHAFGSSVYFASLTNIGITAMLITLSAVLAFAMVWTEFALIASTSALTFMVAGVFKEIVTVIVAHFTFGDEFTAINTLGLAILIAGVCLFNYQKYLKLQHAAVRDVKEDSVPTPGEAAPASASDEAALLPVQ